MIYPEFQKHLKLFPKVFHTHFSGTAERSAFGVQRCIIKLLGRGGTSTCCHDSKKVSHMNFLTLMNKFANMLVYVIQRWRSKEYRVHSMIERV